MREDQKVLLYRSRHTMDLVILMLEVFYKVGDAFGPVGHSSDLKGYWILKFFIN